MAKHVAPARLGSKAKKLWTSVTSEYALRADELRLLEDACREVDLVERLESELEKADLIVRGSQGQPVANPLVQEVRQHRGQLQRLLVALKLPDGEEVPATGSRSSSARDAANARWRRGA